MIEYFDEYGLSFEKICACLDIWLNTAESRNQGENLILLPKKPTVEKVEEIAPSRADYNEVWIIGWIISWDNLLSDELGIF